MFNSNFVYLRTKTINKMGKKEKLFEAFGELIYVVAMADGIIQKEEIDALDNILKTHPNAQEIKWSFDYEVGKENSIEKLYEKVLHCCHQYGPDPEYQNLIDILDAVGKAGKIIAGDEHAIINKFTHELTERFKADIDKLNKRGRDDE